MLAPRVRCIEVGEDGHIILADGVFKKTEVMQKYGLPPRDLRKIGTSNLPRILIRPSVILLNLIHLKALIRCDRVLLFNVSGAQISKAESAFILNLQNNIRHNDSRKVLLPYELRALEAVLSSEMAALEEDLDSMRRPVSRILEELEDDVDRQKLRVLLILSKQVNSFERRARLVRNAIEEILEVDCSLPALHLAENSRRCSVPSDPIEVALLLDSYYTISDEIAQEAQNLASRIKNTEDM
ncbi:hypothetical protein ACCO45_007886 [Purpureocillium lilacinum]|uniref:Uncharacterized protein n=1 Tax=Purpureocillium lilacinum TaxID=33203 RepID=A0ACC4DPU1_PURLI